MTFPQPIKRKKLKIRTFSDAALNISRNILYGETGLILRIFFGDNRNTYHVVDWMSAKQKRVRHSPYGAKILACTDADDRDYNFVSALQSIAPNIPYKHMLLVDSLGLLNTMTTIHKGKDYRPPQTVQKIRNSFDAEKIDVIREIVGKVNLANALAKHNQEMMRHLNMVCKTGFLTLPAHDRFELQSAAWKQ